MIPAVPDRTSIIRRTVPGTPGDESRLWPVPGRMFAYAGAFDPDPAGNDQRCRDGLIGQASESDLSTFRIGPRCCAPIQK